MGVLLEVSLVPGRGGSIDLIHKENSRSAGDREDGLWRGIVRYFGLERGCRLPYRAARVDPIGFKTE